MVEDGRFRFGIEHEVAFVRPLERAAEIADFTNTRFGDLQAVVDGLPVYHDAGLHVDSLKGKVGRWYVEGFDRYDEGGRYTAIPKASRSGPRCAVRSRTPSAPCATPPAASPPRPPGAGWFR